MMNDKISYLRAEYEHQAQVIFGHDDEERNGGGNPPGGNDMEARVAKLETHVEYIRRDLDEVRIDVKAIKSRLAYIAGAGFVVLGIFAWIVNNRFDQVLGLLTKAS